ncbi:hypothetical protein [Actinoplanes couchii]|uniref:Small hydrophilic protein n=1 Tax=Actinoplanes couchii TaxID=403638 RepID=A0ABQ3XR64_9ACTN|nr:hypothetical protein [Actinoplanes couchii]MDR6318208.1 hypothetical protein [Actinoplanes couchii]GID61002.1 hypothetical protein Aco03nite_094060 [Actinoplanes couchii]
MTRSSLVGRLTGVKVLPRLLVLLAVLAVPVLLAVASQAMTRPPDPPRLPSAPIDVSFAPQPSATAPGPVSPSAGPAPGGTPGGETSPSASASPSEDLGVIRTPRPTLDDDDDDLETGDDD